MVTIHQACEEVGVPMVEDKRVRATQVIEILGLIIDTLLVIICIPADKLQDLLQHLRDIILAHMVPASFLQSLSGKLNLVAKAFPLRRPFICRLYDVAVAKHPHKLIQILPDLKGDLELWAVFLSNFKGWVPILDLGQHQVATIEVFTDASAKSILGWGLYIPSKNWWSYGQWQKEYIEQTQPSIDFLEMYAILIFLVMQGSSLTNHWILFRSDNMPTVDALNNMSIHSPHLILLIRIIALICLINNICFSIIHVKGNVNLHADHLSQLKLDHFMQQVPDIDIL